jgi:hypothetical protein
MSDLYYELNYKNINPKCSNIKLTGHLVSMYFFLFLRSLYLCNLNNIREGFSIFLLSWC